MARNAPGNLDKMRYVSLWFREPQTIGRFQDVKEAGVFAYGGDMSGLKLRFVDGTQLCVDFPSFGRELDKLLGPPER